METMEMNRNEIIEQAADVELDYSDIMSTSYFVYEDRLENGNISAKSGKVYKQRMGLKNATEVAKEISYLDDSFTYVKSAKTGKIVAVYLEGDEVA
tara:strand:- start:668 stop:955 length:288 start_codon:yes stop_codon:yes gene_type:complete